MKYMLIDGEIRDFRGRIFVRGVPVEISDKGTLDSIAHNPSFRRVEDEEVKRQETAKEVIAQQTLRRQTLHARRK